MKRAYLRNKVFLFSTLLGFILVSITGFSQSNVKFTSINQPIYFTNQPIIITGQNISYIKLKSLFSEDSFVSTQKIRVSRLNPDTNYTFNIPPNFPDRVYEVLMYDYNDKFRSPPVLIRIDYDKSYYFLSGWGNNLKGQLNYPLGYNFVDISCGSTFAVGLLHNGSLIAWGDTSNGLLNIPSALNNKVVQISAGRNHVLALRQDGNVFAWGNNKFNKTIIPNGTDSIIEVRAGDSFSAAVVFGNRPILWGDTTNGVLNLQDSVNFINLGTYHGVYTTPSNKLRVWGDNKNLTNLKKFTTLAQQLNSIDTTNVLFARTGILHAIAKNANGTVWGWGDTSDNKLNFPFTNDYSDAKTGANHTLLLKNDSSIIVTGNNDFGQSIVPNTISEANSFFIYTNSFADYSFVYRNFNIITSANQYGKIEPSTKALRNQNVQIKYGDATSLNVVRVDSIYLNDIYNEIVTKDSIKSFTFNYINYDNSIRVIFSKNKYNIHTKVKNGSITPDTVATYFDPSRVTYSPKSSKYSIYGIYINEIFRPEVSKDSNQGYTFYKVSADSFINVYYWDSTKPFIRKLEKYLIPVQDTLQVWGKKINYVKLVHAFDTTKLTILNKVSVPSMGDTLYTFKIPAKLKIDRLYKVIAYNAQDSTNECVYQCRLYYNPDSLSYFSALNKAQADGGYDLSIPKDTHDYIYFYGGENHVLGLTKNEKVRAWGDSLLGQTKVPNGLNKVIDIVAGVSYSAALQGDGKIVIWGNNSYDNILYYDTFINYNQILGDDSTQIVALSANGESIIALSNSGKIYTWGDITATTMDSTKTVVPLPNMAYIVNDNVSIVGLNNKDSLLMWNDNLSDVKDVYIYKYGSSSIPLVKGVSTNQVEFLSGGGFHGLGLLKDSSVIQWGSRINGTNSSDSFPTQVSKALGIATGGYFSNTGFYSPLPLFSVVIKLDSTLKTWGSNLPQLNIDTPVKNVLSVSGGAASINYFGLKRILASTQQNLPFQITPSRFVKFQDSFVIQFKADTGYKVDSIFINKKYDSIYKDSLLGKYTFKNIVEDSSFYVKYKLRTFIITTKDTNGSITPTDSNVTYFKPFVVTYSPDTGYFLDSIFINGIYKPQITKDSTKQYTFRKVLKDSSIRVVFSIRKDTIFTCNNKGTISPSPFQTANYFSPVKVTYSAPGYKIDSIYIDNKYDSIATKDSLTQYTFSKILSNHKICVIYKLDSFTIFTRVVNGTISPKDSIRATYLDTIVIIYLPLDSEYRVDSIFISGVYNSNVTRDSLKRYTFRNITKNDSIKVVYKIKDSFLLVAKFNQYIFHRQENLQITGRNIVRLKLTSLLGQSFNIFNSQFSKTAVGNGNKDSIFNWTIPDSLKYDIFKVEIYGVGPRTLPYKLIRIYPAEYDSALYLSWNYRNAPTTLKNVVTMAPARRFNFVLQKDGKLVGWDTLGNIIANLPARFDSSIIDIGVGGEQSSNDATQFLMALRADGKTTSWAEKLGVAELYDSNIIKIFPTRNIPFAVKSDSTTVNFGSLSPTQNMQISNIKTKFISSYAAFVSVIDFKDSISLISINGGIRNFGPQVNRTQNVINLNSGVGFSLLLNNAGNVYSWGDSLVTDLSNPIKQTNVIQIATNAYASVLLGQDQRLKTFGNAIDTPVKNNRIIAVFGNGDIVSYDYMKRIIITTKAINGSITPSGLAKAYDDVKITYQPTPNFVLDSVWIDSIYNDMASKSSQLFYTFIRDTVDHDIVVKFKRDSFIITSSYYGQGTISPLGIKKVAYGDSAEFFMSHPLGSKYDSLIVDSVKQADTPARFVFRNVTRNHTIKAYFYSTIKRYNVTTDVKNGTITPTFMIDSGRDSTVIYNPLPNFIIDSIYINDVYKSTITKDSILGYTFKNIRGDSTIRVVYKAFPKFTITTDVKNGTITPTTGMLDSASNFTVTYQPNQNYILDSIYINNVYDSAITKDSTLSYTFRNIRKNDSILVVYKAYPKFKVTTNVTNGTITSTTGMLDSGSNFTVTYQPNQNYILDSIYINNVYDSAITKDSTLKYTFKNIRKDSSIRVVYKFNGFVIKASIISIGNINANVNPAGDVMVVNNGNQSFTFTYPYNSIYDSLFVDGIKVDTTSVYTFMNVMSNHTIVGYFHEIKVPDSVTNLRAKGANNSAVLTFDKPLNDGGSPILYYRIRSTSNGANIDIMDTFNQYSPFVVNNLTNGLSYCFTVTAVNKVGESLPNMICVTPQANVFTISTFVVNGTITGSFVKELGTDSTITYTNNSYYLLDSILINGIYNAKISKDSSKQYTFKNIRGDSSIKVIYKAYPKYNINTTVVNGMITPSTQTDSTKNFTVTYTNNPYFIIDSIFINGIYNAKITQDSTKQYTFKNVIGDSSIRVLYKPFPKFTITTSVKNGSITDSTIVDSSKNFKVTYIPNTKYLIDSIFINGNYQAQITRDSLTQYTFKNIRGDSSIKVVYKPFPKVNIITSAKNGSITTSTQVDSSDNFTVTYTGNTKYVIDSIFINGIYKPQISRDSQKSYTFYNIRKDSTIRVTFKPFPKFNVNLIVVNGTLTSSFQVDSTDSLRLTYSNNPKYILDSIYINGKYQLLITKDSTQGYTFKNIRGDSVLKVVYKPFPKFTIKVSVINGLKNDTIKVDSTDNYRVTYLSIVGYKPDSIFINGNYNAKISLDSVLGYTFKNVRSDSNIKIVFRKIPQYKIITVVINGFISDTSLVDSSQNFTVTYTNKAKFYLDSIFINGKYSPQITKDSLNRYTFKRVTSDSSIRVKYKPFPKYTITTMAKDGEIIPTTIVDSADDFKVTYKGIFSYQVDSIFINGKYDSQISKDSLSSYTFKKIRGDSSIYVTFKFNGFIINAQVVGGIGNISPLGTIFVYPAESKTFTISYPAQTASYDSLKIDGIKVDTTDQYLFNDINANHTIVAYFRKLFIPDSPRNLTATVGNGSVILKYDSPLNNGGTPILYYRVTTLLNNQMIFDSLYTDTIVVIKGLTNGQSYCFEVRAINKVGESSPTRICNVIPISTKFTVTTSVVNGTIKGSFTIDQGLDSVITYTANKDYILDSIIINGVYNRAISRDSVSQYTFRNIGGDSAIRVVFKYNAFIINAQVVGNGKISPSGIVKVSLFSNQTFDISYPFDAEYDSLIVDSVKIDTLWNHYTFSNISANHTIIAYFHTITVPDSPLMLTALGGNRKAVLSFEPPLNNGGSPILYYRIFSTSSGTIINLKDTNIPISPFVINGLKNDSSYCFNVTAVNKVGESLPAKVCNVIPQVKIATVIPIVVNGTIDDPFQIEFNSDTQIKYNSLVSSELDSIYINGIYNPQATKDSTNGYTFKDIRGDSVIKVVYRIKKFTISTSVNNGFITPTNIVNYGTNFTITYMPKNGYTVDSIFINGIYNSNLNLTNQASYTFENVSGDSNIRVVYKIATFTITTEIVNGTITPTIYNADYFNIYTIIYQPFNQYVVDSIYINGVYDPMATQSKIFNYTIANITKNYSIRIVCQKDSFPIYSSIGGDIFGGNITPLGTTFVKRAGYLIYTTSLNANYVVDSLIVDDILIPYTQDYEFKNVRDTHYIRVVFKKNIYTINIEANMGGTILPTNDTQVFIGDDLQLYFIPDQGYLIDSIYIDGLGISYSSSANPNYKNILTNIITDHNIKVIFKPKYYFLKDTSFKILKTNNPCINDSLGKIDFYCERLFYYNYMLQYPDGTIIYDSFYNTNYTLGNYLKSGLYYIKIWLKNIDTVYFLREFWVSINQPKPITAYSYTNFSQKNVSIDLQGAQTYHVSLNNTYWTTQESQFKLPLQNGLNKIIIKTDQTCLDSVVEQIWIGQEIQLFPNPAHDIINVQLEQTSDIQYEIYNVDGNLVIKGNAIYLLSKNAYRIPIDNLQNGTYLIKFFGTNQNYLGRFIKN